MAEDERRTVMVWAWHQMSAMFAQWSEKYGGVNDQTIYAWQGALSGITVAELIAGVKTITADDRQFLPNFGEFKAACIASRPRGGSNWTEDRAEAERDRQRGGNPVAGVLEQLGKGKLSEVAKAELEKMRQIYAEELHVPKEESWRKLGLDRIRGPLA